MNFSAIFNAYNSSKRKRKFTISCLIFIMFTMLVGCATYQRIQALKAPRFEAGTKEYKGAQSCMECHEEIYQQWKDSRHADATGKWFDDSVQAMPYFPTEMVMGTGMCFACHGPEQLDEGVSCEACHGINDQDDIEKVHEEKYSPGLSDLKQSESCGKCHSNIDPMSEHVLNDNFFEWKESQAAKDNIQCAHCHMKKIGDEPALHGFEKDLPSSLKVHKIGFKDDYLSIVMENQNAAHFLPTGGAPNIYRMTVELLNESDQPVAVLTKDIKKTYSMSFGFPSKLIKDERLKNGEIREIKFPVPDIDKKIVKSINVKISHIEVDLDDDGGIKKIRRETVKLEKKNIIPEPNIIYLQ